MMTNNFTLFCVFQKTDDDQTTYEARTNGSVSLEGNWEVAIASINLLRNEPLGNNNLSPPLDNNNLPPPLDNNNLPLPAGANNNNNEVQNKKKDDNIVLFDENGREIDYVLLRMPGLVGGNVRNDAQDSDAICALSLIFQDKLAMFKEFQTPLRYSIVKPRMLPKTLTLEMILVDDKSLFRIAKNHLPHLYVELHFREK